MSRDNTPISRLSQQLGNMHLNTPAGQSTLSDDGADSFYKNIFFIFKFCIDFIINYRLKIIEHFSINELLLNVKSIVCNYSIIFNYLIGSFNHPIQSYKNAIIKLKVIEKSNCSIGNLIIE